MNKSPSIVRSQVAASVIQAFVTELREMAHRVRPNLRFHLRALLAGPAPRTEGPSLPVGAR